jgi:hypothetical protein
MYNFSLHSFDVNQIFRYFTYRNFLCSRVVVKREYGVNSVVFVTIKSQSDELLFKRNNMYIMYYVLVI